MVLIWLNGIDSIVLVLLCSCIVWMVRLMMELVVIFMFIVLFMLIVFFIKMKMLVMKFCVSDCVLKFIVRLIILVFVISGVMFIFRLVSMLMLVVIIRVIFSLLCNSGRIVSVCVFGCVCVDVGDSVCRIVVLSRI